MSELQRSAFGHIVVCLGELLWKPKSGPSKDCIGGFLFKLSLSTSVPYVSESKVTKMALLFLTPSAPPHTHTFGRCAVFMQTVNWRGSTMETLGEFPLVE